MHFTIHSKHINRAEHRDRNRTRILSGINRIAASHSLRHLLQIIQKIQTVIAHRLGPTIRTLPRLRKPHPSKTRTVLKILERGTNSTPQRLTRIRMNRRRATRIAQQQLRAVLDQLIHHGLLRTKVVIHGSLRNTRPGSHLFNSGVLKPLLGHDIHGSVEQLQLSFTSTAGTTTCSFSDRALQHQKSSLPFCRYISILLDSFPRCDQTGRVTP